MITAENLRRLLTYAPNTGTLEWCVSPRYGIQIGDTAASLDTRGHLQIKIGGRIYAAHRLAFLWMTGAWPRAGMDH